MALVLSRVRQVHLAWSLPRCPGTASGSLEGCARKLVLGGCLGENMMTTMFIVLP